MALLRKDTVATLLTSSLFVGRDGKPSAAMREPPISASVQEQAIKEWQLPEKFVRQLRPKMCEAVLYYFALQAGGPLDFQIEIYAGQLGKPLLALDTEELREMSSEVNGESSESCSVERLLRDSSAEAFRLTLSGMATRYRSGDVFEASERSVHYRNAVWMHKLRPILKRQDRVFVVVGVGHLYGPLGLLPALEEAGYEVQRIRKSQDTL